MISLKKTLRSDQLDHVIEKLRVDNTEREENLK